MGKVMLLATIIVVGAALIWGISGVLWIDACFLPFSIGLYIVARILKWL